MDTLSRIRRLRAWVEELSGGSSPTAATLGAGAMTLLAGAALTGCAAYGAGFGTSLWPMFHALAAYMFVMSLGSDAPIPETIPVRGWQLAAAGLGAHALRVGFTTFALALLTPLMFPLLSWLAAPLDAFLPTVVRVADEVLQHPLSVHGGTFQLEMSPLTWAARGMAARLVTRASCTRLEGRRPWSRATLFAMLLVLITQNSPSTFVEMTLVAALLMLGIANAELVDRPAFGPKAAPHPHTTRPYRAGVRAVLRDVQAAYTFPPSGLLPEGRFAVVALLTITMVLPALGPKIALLMLPTLLLGVWLVGPALASTILGVPASAGRWLLPGIPETLPLPSRRYVAATLAQGLPVALVAALLGGLRGGAWSALTWGGMALLVCWSSLLHLWWESQVWWDGPTAGEGMVWKKGGSTLILLLAWLTVIAISTPAAFALAAAWHIPLLWSAGRRLLRDVP